MVNTLLNRLDPFCWISVHVRPEYATVKSGSYLHQKLGFYPCFCSIGFDSKSPLGLSSTGMLGQISAVLVWGCTLMCLPMVALRDYLGTKNKKNRAERRSYNLQLTSFLTLILGLDLQSRSGLPRSTGWAGISGCACLRAQPEFTPRQLIRASPGTHNGFYYGQVCWAVFLWFCFFCAYKRNELAHEGRKHQQRLSKRIKKNT